MTNFQGIKSKKVNRIFYVTVLFFSVCYSFNSVQTTTTACAILMMKSNVFIQ